MFGQAPIHGRKTFAADPSNTLRVHNAFFTLQGEGPLAGQPSVFLRLSHCNLQCSFCDTDYEQSNLMDFAEIELYLQRKILAHFHGDLPAWAQWRDYHPRQINLVITGGEPTLQTNLVDFVAYMERRYAGDDPIETPEYQTIQFESNGLLPWIEPNGHVTEDVLLVVSPKCLEDANKTPTKYLRPHPTVFKRANCFKFVVSADTASAYHTPPDWPELQGKPVYVSPMNMYHREPAAKLLAAKRGQLNDLATREALERVSFWETGLLNMEENRANHEHAAKVCMDRGFRLSLQTHLLASLP